MLKAKLDASLRLGRDALYPVPREGMADVAFGIEAAARAHGLAFVGLVTEHYYLACRRSTSARIAIDTMVASAKSSAFRRAIAKVGGYDCDATGEPVHLSDLFRR